MRGDGGEAVQPPSVYRPGVITGQASLLTFRPKVNPAISISSIFSERGDFLPLTCCIKRRRLTLCEEREHAR